MYSSLRKQLHYGSVFTEAEEGSSPLTTLHRQNRPGQLPWLYLQLAAHYNAYLSSLRLLVIGHTSSRSITNLYVCVLTASATRRFALLCHGDNQGAGCKWHRWSFYLLYLGAVKFFPAWAFYASIICQNTSAFSLQSALKKKKKACPSLLVERRRERAFYLNLFSGVLPAGLLSSLWNWGEQRFYSVRGHFISRFRFSSLPSCVPSSSFSWPETASQTKALKSLVMKSRRHRQKFIPVY